MNWLWLLWHDAHAPMGSALTAMAMLSEEMTFPEEAKRRLDDVRRDIWTNALNMARLWNVCREPGDDPCSWETLSSALKSIDPGVKLAPWDDDLRIAMDPAEVGEVLQRSVESVLVSGPDVPTAGEKNVSIAVAREDLMLHVTITGPCTSSADPESSGASIPLSAESGADIWVTRQILQVRGGSLSNTPADRGEPRRITLMLPLLAHRSAETKLSPAPWRVRGPCDLNESALSWVSEVIRGLLTFLDGPASILRSMRREELFSPEVAQQLLRVAYDNMVRTRRVLLTARKTSLLLQGARASAVDARCPFPHLEAILAPCKSRRSTNIHVLLELGEREGLIVDVDPQDVEVALYVVMKNTQDYGTGRYQTSITVDRSDSSLRIVVANVGLPLTAAEVERCFEPGWRSPRAAALRHGHGYGLWTARQLLRARGGDVTLAPSGGDGITRVTLTLPLLATAR